MFVIFAWSKYLAMVPGFGPVYLWTLEIKRGPDEPGDLGHRDNSIREGLWRGSITVVVEGNSSTGAHGQQH
jgi:hypothetical protein